MSNQTEEQRVSRYVFEPYDGGPSPNPNGDWVKFNDYDRLIAALERLRQFAVRQLIVHEYRQVVVATEIVRQVIDHE